MDFDFINCNRILMNYEDYLYLLGVICEWYFDSVLSPRTGVTFLDYFNSQFRPSIDHRGPTFAKVFVLWEPNIFTKTFQLLYFICLSSIIFVF